MAALRNAGRMLTRRVGVAAVVTVLSMMSAQMSAHMSAWAADTIDVKLDQATLLKLPPNVATVVIGNPMIADAAMQPGGLLVITGKGYGSTNMIALDRAGEKLMDRSVEVSGPRDNVVVVYRGVERESYSCTPQCERRITLGDAPPYFESTVAQSGTRNGAATGAAPAAK
jgi:Flp pilus assembly secretin CpaC